MSSYSEWSSSLTTAINNVHDSEIANNYLAVNKAYDNREVLYNVTNSQIYNNIIRHAKDPNFIFANSDAVNNNSTQVSEVILNHRV